MQIVDSTGVNYQTSFASSPSIPGCAPPDRFLAIVASYFARRSGVQGLRLIPFRRRPSVAFTILRRSPKPLILLRLRATSAATTSGRREIAAEKSTRETENARFASMDELSSKAASMGNWPAGRTRGQAASCATQPVVESKERRRG